MSKLPSEHGRPPQFGVGDEYLIIPPPPPTF
jgi:hypothetical protein